MIETPWSRSSERGQRRSLMWRAWWPTAGGVAMVAACSGPAENVAYPTEAPPIGSTTGWSRVVRPEANFSVDMPPGAQEAVFPLNPRAAPELLIHQWSSRIPATHAFVNIGYTDGSAVLGPTPDVALMQFLHFMATADTCNGKVSAAKRFDKAVELVGRGLGEHPVVFFSIACGDGKPNRGGEVHSVKQRVYVIETIFDREEPAMAAVQEGMRQFFSSVRFTP